MQTSSKNGGALDVTKNQVDSARSPHTKGNPRDRCERSGGCGRHLVRKVPTLSNASRFKLSDVYANECCHPDCYAPPCRDITSQVPLCEEIGTTRNLCNRLKDLTIEEIVGFELGGVTLERSRHRKFQMWRMHNEWFELSPAVRSHINGVTSLAD